MHRIQHISNDSVIIRNIPKCAQGIVKSWNHGVKNIEQSDAKESNKYFVLSLNSYTIDVERFGDISRFSRKKRSQTPMTILKFVNNLISMRSTARTSSNIYFV